MSITLNAPLAWKTANPAEVKMLQSLQGNILKGHGRDFTANIFFRFGANQPRECRRVLRELANAHITNAHRQLLDNEIHKQAQASGQCDPVSQDPFVHVALSFQGYVALGVPEAAPQDEDFRAGMRAAQSLAALNDPAVAQWEAPFQEDIHGMLLAAHADEAALDLLCEALSKLLSSMGVSIVHTQRGKAIKNEAGKGIEHFGYVDGRSQPLMLEEDIEQENATGGGMRWDPRFPLSTALIKDPGVDDDFSFGSLFIFRKLEQRVRAFKTREQEIASTLGLQGAARELAGALLVGRFEDGTPVTLFNQDHGPEVPNDFNYAGDSGTRCPFHAHIRKSNPRGSGGAEPEAAERLHLMARRGIPFEDKPRTVAPKDLPDAESFDEFREKVQPDLPVDGVGLLFMAYNRAIAEQFKFTQQLWVNNSGFPLQAPGVHGIDPVIGQGTLVPGEQRLPLSWDDPSAGSSDQVDFSGFVRMKGGEYFFSPSLAFFKDL